MINRSVARRYARALFELLDPPSVEPVRAGLTSLSAALAGSAALKHVMASPAFGTDEKVAVLTELGHRAGCPEVVDRFLRQLVLKNRVGELAGIAEVFAELADETKGAQSVTVMSALPLQPPEQKRLQARLRELIGGPVALTHHTDPTLLSGLRVQVGSLVYDGTVRNRLSSMRALLTKE